MESVADWCHMYRRALSLAQEGRRGEPPVIHRSGLRLWDARNMRDECELGPRVGWEINQESHAAESVRLDAILKRGYHAYPMPLLEMLAT